MSVDLPWSMWPAVPTTTLGGGASSGTAVEGLANGTLEGPASRLAAALRRGEPPVLVRIESGRCCVDLRTVLRGQDDQLQDAIEAAVGSLRA